MNFYLNFLVVVFLMKFPNLVIKEILFIFESFRSPNILQKKMSESCGDDISVPGGQLDSRLATVVHGKSRPSMLIIIPLEIKLGEKKRLGNHASIARSLDFLRTLVEGQRRNVTSLFGMNFKRNSFITNCFGET